MDWGDDNTSVGLGKEERCKRSKFLVKHSEWRVLLRSTPRARGALRSPGQDGWTWAAVAPEDSWGLYEHQRQVRDEKKHAR